MVRNRVLIVDDDQRICRIIKRIADNIGIESMTTDKAEWFISAYLNFEPNVVFMDLQMPHIDGVELLRFLAKNDSEAAIILITGMDKSVVETTESLGISLGLNMAGSLRKPIDIDDAKSMLERQFGPFEKKDNNDISISAHELSEAIDQNQLVVHYQPKLLLQTGELIGAEALVRWQHPSHGLLYPDAFISVAEGSVELIDRLTDFVLNTVLRKAIEWRDQGMQLSFSLNLSATSLVNLRLPDNILQILRIHGFDPNMLVLEITESVAMEDPSRTMDILTRFRLKNIQLSIDDFGTGYSSLVQLYRLPFTEMKIDKSFVMKSMLDEEAASIVRITIELGHSLGLTVVAEGIENQETYDWLKELGCEIGQGYFISKPIDARRFPIWIQQHEQQRNSAVENPTK